jgi:hypothetical protein
VHNKIEHRNIVAYGGFKKSIRMDLGEVGWGDVDWIGFVWLRIGTGREIL